MRIRDNLESDLNKITQLAIDNQAENKKFKLFLETRVNSEEVDNIVHRLYEQISPNVDCTICGNCCKLMEPVFKKKDINRLATGLADDEYKSIKKCFIEDTDDGSFNFKIKPCMFLKQSKCLQYLLRPDGCRSYPHLDRKDFTGSLDKVIYNYSICPIVFNVFESLKIELGQN